MDLAFPGYHYSPDFRLFFDVLSTHRIGDWRKNEASRTAAAMRLQAPLYNQFITDLREEGKRRNVSKQVWDWKEGLSSQEKSVRKFVLELRATKKRLIPLRVDFYYGASAAVEDDAMPRICWSASSKERHADDRFDASGWTGAFEVRARIDSARAMQDRARFFENQNGVDRELFDTMLSYVCKLEVGGRYRANHFHILFLFDAARIRSYDLDRLLSQVEDRWYRVTGGLGMVFDSRNRRDVHELRERGRWALDPIDCSNDEQLTALEKYVLSYFTKDKGQLLRIKPTPKANTLTTGQVGR
ncbi:inovirus-type Gp2 protein [Burkholderia multivorans]|uniref:inovirus-type Gp2 protein n=1 Tax=Burkholderia multivorans TaxID=87883 RepID=UPI002019C084|nr:inovirus-type Gp2 protein [Burkholderia multivorans]UQO99564.1 inovirus-type Gp2 protein [Burkholderia multivorans]